MKKPTHGGKRKGAGRPKTKEETIVMRIPISKIEQIKKIVKCSYCGGTGFDPYPNHDTTMRPCPKCQP